MTEQTLNMGTEIGALATHNQFLSFFLNEEEYALDIRQVQEIIGMQKITAIPLVSSHVKGIINLRGRIIPTLDLRARFQMDEIAYTKETCIIVVEIASTRHTMRVGLIVDRVNEVFTLTNDNIHTDRETIEELNSEYLLGVAVIEEKVKMLLALEKVISFDEVEKISRLADSEIPG